MKIGAHWQELMTDLALGLFAVLVLVAIWRFRRRRPSANPPSVDTRTCPSKWGDIQSWVDLTEAPLSFCVSVPPTAEATAVAVTMRSPNGSERVLNLTFKRGYWRSVEPISDAHGFVAEIAVASPDGLAILSADFTGTQP